MTKRIISALSLFAATAFIAPFAHASSVPGNGTVTAIGTTSSSVFATVSVTNATGSVPCGTLGTYSIDTSTAQGKAMLSTLEGAQLAGKRVGLGGSGTCVGGAEGLAIITVFTN
jgi:hypothetical protein